MKVLAVETATAWQSVAVVEDTAVLACVEQEAAGSHGLLLLPAIERVLAEAGLALGRLDGLVCSIGPGSFTGLRVGAATMMGLRAATDLPLALVPTLEAMAWNLRGHAAVLGPVVTSRKGELYWAFYRWREAGLERICAERAGTPLQLAQDAAAETVLFGEGWRAMEADIRAGLPRGVTVGEVPFEVSRPSAVSVGRAGMERLRRGEFAGETIAPLYVQRPEAEVKFEQTGGLSAATRRQARVAQKTAARAGRGGRPGQGARG